MLARDVWQLLRPTQWAKNTVLFAALIFSKHLFEWSDALRVVAAFVCFCAVASGAYVMNDLRDCERDRQHPLKSRRPLPSGRVPRGAAEGPVVGASEGNVVRCWELECERESTGGGERGIR